MFRRWGVRLSIKVVLNARFPSWATIEETSLFFIEKNQVDFQKAWKRDWRQGSHEAASQTLLSLIWHGLLCPLWHHKWFISRAEWSPSKIIKRLIFFPLMSWGAHHQARGTIYIWKINYCWTLEPRKRRWFAPVKTQQQCRAPLEPRGGDWPSMRRQQKDGLEVGAPAQKRSTGPAGSGCQDAEGRGTFSD